MILIAHRGESYDAPENTLASINLAWEREADAVEIDVHLTKDGKIVAIHDNNTWKVAGKFKSVKDQTLAELKRLDVGKYKGQQWKDERIPTLEEVLETVPGGKYLFIEIKCGSEIFPALKSVLKNLQLNSEQIKFIGFDWEAMKILKSNLPQYEVFLLFDIKKDKKEHTWHPEVDEMLEQAEQAGVNGLDVRACEAVTKTFVARVTASNMKLYVWTVNNPAEAKRLIEAGIDGITTDRQQWLKAELELNNWLL